MDYQFDENYTVTEDKLGTKIEHPSFGTVGFYRTTGGNKETLFGTGIQHSDTIQLIIRHGSMTRGINNDWYSGGHEMLVVEMSNYQFAELLTNMNNGTGIPCTIRFTEKDGRIPECHFINKYKELHEEFKESLDTQNQEAETIFEEIKTLFETKSSIGKTDRNNILDKLRHIVFKTKADSKYIMSQFQEQSQKIVTEAKQEIDAFTTNRMLQIAEQTLVSHRDDIPYLSEKPIITLPGDPEESTENDTEIAKDTILTDTKIESHLFQSGLLKPEMESCIHHLTPGEILAVYNYQKYKNILTDILSYAQKEQISIPETAAIKAADNLVFHAKYKQTESYWDNIISAIQEVIK